jgi:hypothetical protein
MQARDTNQVELAMRSGLVVSRVNNYLQGHYRTITPAHLVGIVKGLDGTPTDNAALIQAYLYDLLPERARGLIDVRCNGARESGKWKLPTDGLPTDFAEKIRDLYVLCATRAKVRQRTAEWIALMRETKE